MGSSENSRSSSSAVAAVRAVAGGGLSAEIAADVVEALRPHLERPLQLALSDALRRVEELQEEVAALREG